MIIIDECYEKNTGDYIEIFKKTICNVPEKTNPVILISNCEHLVLDD